MKKETLISLNAFELCDTKEALARYLINTFKENGSVYFEHGYSEPSFMIKGFGYVTLYAITDAGDVHFSIPNKGCDGLVKINELSFSQLQRLIYLCNDYLLYCQYEA